MTELAIFEILRGAFWTAVLMSLPILGVTLVIGFVIGLLQALTSIQELTLTFVPKIIVIFLGIVFMLPFMINTVTSFADTLFDRITGL